jgi:hypothetical protein
MKILKTKKYSILSAILKYSFVILFAVLVIGHNAIAICPDGTNSNPCPAGVNNTGSSNAGVNNTGSSNAGVNNTGSSNAGVDNTSGIITTKIENPLGSKIVDLPSFIKVLIDIVLVVGVPVIALAIIYTGFLFVKAQGAPEELTKAKKSLTFTLIGAALLLGAFVIANAIGETVKDITSTT